MEFDVIISGLIRGEKTEDALIRNWNNMGIDSDPNANQPLLPSEIRAIQDLPDVIEGRSHYENLVKAAKAKYGTLKQAPGKRRRIIAHERRCMDLGYNLVDTMSSSPLRATH
ncbi:hypothetical protein M433DRAFT_7050 [Acidomyces richmondensis BFW]|nr:hypothetical protein M433DRAFT_7050 [Acidomyces richmondensis BFW]